MTRSMTGFGRTVATLAGESVTVELSAVNHRFLDSSFRMPYAWAALEGSLRELVKRHVARGKVSVSFRRERGPTGRPVVRCDETVAKEYIEAARELARAMRSTESLSLDTLMQLDGVFFQEEEKQDLDEVKQAMEAALVEALGQFNDARKSEGAALAGDVRERIAQMRDALQAVDARLPELAEAHAARLRERIAELNAEAGLKEERLAMELAFLADKADVNEELVRLKAHFEHVETLLDSSEAIGRELNFLSQEIQREINTLGSKLRDVGISREVLRMKSELEKLREQAQNIE